MISAPPAKRPVRLINYLAYGSNDVLGAGSMAVISGWVLIFYTQFCGLTAGQAALIFAVARILDAIASPVIGYLSDHFGTTALGRRFGRRRFFILAAIPLLPSFALMWLPGMSFWYYLVSYVGFELVYAMVIIPYETLAAEMSTDYRTKAKFAGFRILFGQTAAILAGFLPLWLINYLGRDSAQTFFYMGVIFAALFMATAGFLYRFSWERPLPAQAGPRANAGVGSAFRALYRNLFSTMRIRAFRLHLGMYLGGYISQDIFNAAFTFFVIFALAGTTAMASGLLGTMYIVQFVAVVIAINLALRASPAFAYRLAAVTFGLGVIVLLSLWAGGTTATSPLIYLAIGLAGLGRGALNYIPWATYNYMADVDEIVTGQRREGSFAGVMTFVRKATQAAAVAGVGLVIQAGGFVSGAQTQTPEAINTIALLLGVGTLGVLVAGIVVSLRFRLDPRTHAILMEEIERLRSGDPTPPDPLHKAVVEDLSGWPHDRLWGNNPVAAKVA
ncbi:MFS transporter [Sphingomonas sp. Leaf24]|uniref:MFS transporter n=1 Tax=unclassified Sphingomonas TaxID=196159 RepID=UPI0006F4F760|nr:MULTISPECIES: MFS transporter [unclassified Sphingomonas]KQM18512.1 MFS transporter [Sphingomonas sp. Leaf5]KQM89273.1 MFS transporter [Sphingomonas sp. Leaf24]